MVKHAKKIKKSLTFRPKNVDLALILSTLEIIGNLKAVAVGKHLIMSESTPVKKGIVTAPTPALTLRGYVGKHPG